MLRLRTELQWSPIVTRRGWRWCVYDPISAKHYRFSSEEKWLLLQIEFTSSLDRLLAEFETQFTGTSITKEQLEQLISLATKAGLLTRLPDGLAELKDASKRTPAKSVGAVRFVESLPWQLLFAKLSLWNPQPFLTRLAPYCKWWVGRRGLFVFVPLMILSGLLTLSRWSEILSVWPDWSQLARPQMLLGLGLAFALTKVVHELGHGIACVRLGGRCSDTGVFMMMGMICPYVDVSTSWRFKHAWQRAAVAAAGVYAECTVGAVFALIWFCTRSGPLHDFAWQIMFVTTVSTVLFNANPFMRYDGYFLLSDVVDIPNLRDHAMAALKRTAASLLLGVRTSPSIMIPSSVGRVALVGFGLGSTVYRIVLICGIGTAVVAMANQWHLRWMGFVVVGLLAISVIVIPILTFFRWTTQGLASRSLRPLRTLSSWALLSLLIGVAIWMPIPQRFYCEGLITINDRTPVFAQVSGIIESEHAPTREIRSIKISNPELAVIRLESELGLIEAKQHVTTTRRAAFAEPDQLDVLPWLENQLSWNEAKLLRHRDQENAQHVFDATSVKSATFISALAMPLQDATKLSQDRIDRSVQLWTDDDCQGRYVPEGTLLGWQVEHNAPIVETQVSENKLPWVQVGYRAKIVLAQAPNRTYEGKVSAVNVVNDLEFDDSSNISSFNANVSAGGGKYRVQIELTEAVENGYLLGGKAHVVIQSQKRSLLAISTDWAHRNFRLR